jgi:hypothetical protein
MEHSRLAELAKEDPDRKFFWIAHLLTPQALYEAFLTLRKDARWSCSAASRGRALRERTGVSGFWRVGGSAAGEPLSSS